MARLRCRFGLHRWKQVASRRPGKATFECEHCRQRYLVPLPSAQRARPAPAKARPLDLLQRLTPNRKR